jgi:hypothetical protein
MIGNHKLKGMFVQTDICNDGEKSCKPQTELLHWNIVQNAPHVEELILEFQLDATLKLSGIDCF